MSAVVSIITPSFNQAAFIERTVQSVLGQHMPQMEYVVVDGGSSDHTVGILRRYADRLRWVSEKDQGQADAVNKGIRMTSGKIIGWLNSDDVYYPGAVSAACDYLAAHPECDVLFGDANHIDATDKILERYPTQPWDPKLLPLACYLCQPAVFFRRSVIERHGLLDEKLQYCMDYEYWLRLAANGACVHKIDRVLAGSRLHAGAKTVHARFKVHREINDMMRRQVGRVPASWLYNYACTFLEAKGVGRSRSMTFALCLLVLVAYASLRWNHRLPRAVLRAAWEWHWNNTASSGKGAAQKR